jgi:hypothetical protein
MRDSQMHKSKSVGSPRNPYIGLILWAVSQIAFVASWIIIYLVSQNAGGTWPVALNYCLKGMYILCGMSGFVAAKVFRAESLKFIAANEHDPQKVDAQKRAANITALCMICCPFFMITAFLFIVVR